MKSEKAIICHKKEGDSSDAAEASDARPALSPATRSHITASDNYTQNESSGVDALSDNEVLIRGISAQRTVRPSKRGNKDLFDAYLIQWDGYR